MSSEGDRAPRKLWIAKEDRPTRPGLSCMLPIAQLSQEASCDGNVVTIAQVTKDRVIFASANGLRDKQGFCPSSG
jgi:hypothetical protein